MSVDSTRAVVIGGSMAGLCAARVLSDKFDRVTVIESDSYPDEALDRAGVPQGRHVHGLLARGRLELERLFPGFTAATQARGALDLDVSESFAVLRDNRWMPRRPVGVPTLFATRALVESTVRGLAQHLHNVEFIQKTQVVGLLLRANGHRRISGVVVRGPEGQAETQIRADLVVDASGRRSQAPQWLNEFGLDAPAETVVDPLAGYSSRAFAAPTPRPDSWWWQGIVIFPVHPEQKRGAAMFPAENGKWIVSLIGVAGERVPGDEAGFAGAVGSLPVPLLAEALQRAEPISRVYCHRALANVFRRYDRLQEPVPGFIALGDAVCTFNPTYGQGMTCAAASAGILARVLRRHSGTDVALPRVFFRAQGKFLRDAWSLATGVDFRWPQTIGDRPGRDRFLSPYFERLLRISLTDDHVRRRLVEVLHLLRSPASLMDPAILARAAFGSLSSGPPVEVAHNQFS